jgi:Asp-tRNA(Asn)/Glu-tRNA(Gln) amidotransferase A subunit family amidase
MPPTIHEAAEAIRSRKLSPVDLLRQCLDRIDKYEPAVKAWVFVDRDGALETAKEREEQARSSTYLGPLHGIPLGIKDIIDVYDWPTAAGSRRWSQSVARHDAEVVRRLRAAGAVLVGKTVTTQFASFDPPPTRNPWDRSRTPGGSSSGSAAAVACGMCPGALGTQTGGSITRPAAYCGVAGCKPTYRRVSTRGIVPLAASMDHPGPMARTVRDLALLLQALATHGLQDSTCAVRSVPDYCSALFKPLPKPRLARLVGLFDDLAEPPVRRMMAETCDRLRSEGAVVTDVAPPAGFARVLHWHRTVMAVEAAAYHGPRLRNHPEDYQPRIRSLIEEGLACPAPEYARSVEQMRRLRDEVRACLTGFDALLTPAATGPAPDAATTGDPAFNSPWSFTGLPTVSVPAGWAPDGLPLALQFIGRPWSEARLLMAAAWCEDRLGFERREPPLPG